MNYTSLLLPPSVVTRVDVARLVAEVETIDAEQTAAAIRQKVASFAPAAAILSAQLQDFLQVNTLTLETPPLRAAVLTQLRQLKQHAPVLHMTFAVSADRESLGQMVAWLRSSIHRQALVEVGLQPGLVAGVYLRTPNHVHDFSMRSALHGRRDLLVKGLEAISGSR